LELRAYSDADWAGDPTDRKSTTGFGIFLGVSLILVKVRNMTLSLTPLQKLSIVL